MTKKTNFGITPVLLIISFIVFSLIGNLLNGEKPEIEPGFYSFLYQVIPSFLGNAVGLPVNGGFGTVFTLVSSTILFILSSIIVLKKDDEGTIFIGRLAVFSCTFIFVSMVASVMVSHEVSKGFLAHKFWSFLPLIPFIIILIVSVGMLFSENKTSYYIQAILASFGIGLAVAGYAHTAIKLGVDKYVMLPSRFSEAFYNFVNASEYGVKTVLICLVIQVALLAGIMICLYLYSGKRGCFMDYTIVGFAAIMICAFSPVKNFTVFPQGIKYWILFVIMIFFVACFAKREGDSFIKTFIGGLGMITLIQSLYYSIVFFYDAIAPSLPLILEDVSPFRDAVVNWTESLTKKIAPDENWGVIISHIIIPLIILGVTLLLYLLIGLKKINNDTFFENSNILSLASFIFLCGVVIQSSIFIEYKAFVIIAYVMLSVSFFMLFLCLFMNIFFKNVRGVFKVLYCILISVILTPLYSFFSTTVGIIVAGVGLAIIAIKTAKEIGDSEFSTLDSAAARIFNFADYVENMSLINDAAKAGASRLEVEAATLLVTQHAKNVDNMLKRKSDK